MNESISLEPVPQGISAEDIAAIVEPDTDLYSQLKAEVDGIPPHRVATEVLNSNDNLEPLCTGCSLIEQCDGARTAIDAIAKPFVPVSRPFRRHEIIDGQGLHRVADDFLVTLPPAESGTDDTPVITCAIVEVGRVGDAEYVPQALASTEELARPDLTKVAGLVQINPDHTIQTFSVEQEVGDEIQGEVKPVLTFRPLT